MGWIRILGAVLVGAALAAPVVATAQARTGPPAREAAQPNGDELVQLDFDDVELPVVIDTIARLTGRNFIYDDRVRGRVTIVSPTRISVDQAYAVFESVLQVKGFTTVPGPGGAIKIIPVRDAKQSSIPTTSGRRPAPRRDQFITRLIPLRYIDAEAITNTLKPLVSNDAAMVAYAPTNTVILTDAASNIRRILAILESIDVETYKEELAVLRLQHADANTLAQQLSEVFGGAVTGASAAPTRTVGRTRRPAARTTATAQPAGRGQPRIITDERTNSLIVLASRSQLEDIRAFVRTIDVPVEGGGRIQVYYLKHADAEELAQTLNALISGQPAPSTTAGAAAGAQPQALRAAVTELAGGATVTADAGTNSLVIQASPEGYASLVAVIEQLDIPRPQVLVEALIMEVDVTDSQDLGFNGLARLVRGGGDTDITLATATTSFGDTGAFLDPGTAVSGSFLGNLIRDTLRLDADDNVTGGSVIQTIITASATDNNTNILSSPHILTSDNEEAEILVGDNIPIITSRVQAATGAQQDTTAALSTSVNVERQDIGVTLRVTPQITEGDSLRLKIFQEITAINTGLNVGNPENVGVPLSNRRVDNTVVVADGETVVIGGLISEDYNDSETKVPWLGDIPVLGWLFKTTSNKLTKKNLLVFLTPHIVRSPADLEYQTVRKREEFRRRSEQSLGLYDPAADAKRLAEAGLTEADLGLLAAAPDDQNAPRAAITAHEQRYPLARMREIEEQRAREREELQRTQPGAAAPSHYEVLAGVYRDTAAAQEALARLLAAGYEGALVSAESQGAVVLELRLGPYGTLEDAERAAHEVRERYDMTPRVLVEETSP